MGNGNWQEFQDLVQQIRVAEEPQLLTQTSSNEQKDKLGIAAVCTQHSPVTCTAAPGCRRRHGVNYHPVMWLNVSRVHKDDSALEPAVGTHGSRSEQLGQPLEERQLNQEQTLRV